MKKLIALVIVIFVFSIVQFGNAQTIYVNSLTGNDATGNGTSGSPYKTFHKGYTIASAGNTINLTGTFTWTDADETGDAVTTGYTLGKNIIITGQGAGSTIIQSATTVNTADRRVFTISTSAISVTIQDLTIRYGKIGASQSGAGIATGTYGPTSNATINIYRCIIERNTATESYYAYGGGGISAYMYNGIMTIDKCTIQYNTAPNFGGGIYAYSDNTGYVNITNSTINNNTASCGTAIGAYYGKVKVSNSTVCLNTGNYTIYNGAWGAGYFYFTNVTVAFNTLGATSGYGLNISQTTTYIKNTILAQNKAVNGTQSDFYNSSSTLYNNGNNIVEVPSSSGFTNGVNGCIVGVQANLKLSNTLGYNSTSNGTYTLTTTSGSVAINAGATGTNGSESVPAYDQRGFSRRGNTDIGAYEYYVFTWKGNTSTDFNTASNWNETEVPPSGNDIAFDPAPSNNCILDANRTIGNLDNAQSTYNFVLNGYNLTINGNVNLTNGAQINASTGAVIFQGPASQILSANSLQTVNDLTINNSYGVTLSGNLTVNNTLTLTTGLFTLGTSNLTLGASATISGTPSATNMIIATSTGELRKTFTGTGSFIYPVGDNTSAVEYSPITLNFTSGTFSSAYAGVTLGNSKYSNNTSVTDYLNRYWTVNQSGISDFSCDVTAQYLVADIIGTESNVYCGKYDGSSWALLNQADAVNHRLTGTVTGFSTFTGGQQTAMPVELSAFNSIVSGRDVKLNWVTASETNNAGFEIQRAEFRIQNSEFRYVGFINGKGNSNTPTNYIFADAKLNSGKYNYRLKQIDNNGNFEYHILNNTVEIGVPTKFSLSQNYPNPFNPKTKIDFQIPNDAKVTMKIYDVTGREIVTLLNSEYKKADYYTLDFNATNIASGIYFYRIIAEKFIAIKKMVLIK